MKETKVYVDELPKSCVGCKYFVEHRRQCNLELCLQWSEEKFKFNDCPLIDIKTHDRELVKEVCDKIKQYFNENLDNCEEYHCCGFNGKQIKDIYDFIENLQKEYEK